MVCDRFTKREVAPIACASAIVSNARAPDRAIVGNCRNAACVRSQVMSLSPRHSGQFDVDHRQIDRAAAAGRFGEEMLRSFRIAKVQQVGLGQHLQKRSLKKLRIGRRVLYIDDSKRLHIGRLAGLPRGGKLSSKELLRRLGNARAQRSVQTSLIPVQGSILSSHAFRDDPAKGKFHPVSGPAADLGEELLADEIDDIVPSRGTQKLPVVALGGSAGSIRHCRSSLS